MKNYNVKEIADMLNTNPETVRRWIRDDKLEAIKGPRKTGNVVTEAMLQTFLKSSPKYAGVATSLLANPVSLTITAATLLGGIITNQHMKNECIKNAQVNSTEVVKLLRTDIENRRVSIKRKEQALFQLQDEIEEEQKHIEEANQLIEFLSNPDLEQEQTDGK